MLPIPIMEQFDELLLELPALISGSSYELPRRAEAWLKSAAALAESFHLSVAADLALVEGSLATYRPDHNDRAADRQALTRRYTVECLEKGRGHIGEAFAPHRAVCLECEELCMQAAAVALARGLVHPGCGIRALTEKLRLDEALLPVLTKIIGMVGASNATILLDRALSQTEIKEESA